MDDVIILLGSNIDPAMNIRLGAQMLAERLAIHQFSSVWLTPAAGTTGPDFYNSAVRCSSDLDAEILKYRILRPIEVRMGRIRTSDKYAPRTIDLDAIILNGIVLEPRLWDTSFILLPVAELVPELIHPETGETLDQISQRLAPISGASRLSDFYLFDKPIT
jgi:2-amino-4-hydroxy-6-hydroxymethyldihydropteridine diphosphokinase